MRLCEWNLSGMTCCSSTLWENQICQTSFRRICVASLLLVIPQTRLLTAYCQAPGDISNCAVKAPERMPRGA